MSQKLKLANLKSFVSPFTGAVIVKKGEVVRVDDKVAAKLVVGGRVNMEGEFIPYWTEPKDSEEVTHDFTATSSEDEATAQAAPASKPASQRRRATA